jgi:hypothetical protein
MASYSVARAANKTLSTTVVDDVTLTEPHGRVQVLNRGTGTATIWVTSGATPADPVAEADDTIPVYAGERVTVATGTQPGYVVKVVGSADPYSVVGLPRED